MNQIERESLVERYLAGEMTPAEESDFFLHVAVDDELQRTLKAFRIMDQAILNDRETAVADRSRYREQVFGMLAASHVSTGAAGGAGSTAPLQGGAAAGGLGAWKTLLISLVAGGLAIGTAAVVLPSIGGGDDPAPATGAAPSQSLPRTIAPLPAGPAVKPAPEASAGSDGTGAISGGNEVRGNAPALRPAEKERAAPSRNGSNVRESSVEKPAVTQERAKEEEYIWLPDEGKGEVKIPTEVEKNQQNP